ncbi:MAG: SpoIIE family protein phosphatase [Spirochaetaceae bacterium]
MKIQTKITLIQLTTVLCILFSIFILYTSFNNIQKLKNIQVEFNRLVDMGDSLSELFSNSLYTDENIVDYSLRITSKHDELLTLLDYLYDKITTNHKDLEESFKKFYYTWSQQNASYYLPITSTFRGLIDPNSGWIPIIASNGIIKSYDIIYERMKSDNTLTSKFTTLRQLITQIEAQDYSYLSIDTLIVVVQDDLIYEVDRNIATNTLFLIFFTIVIVIAAMNLSLRVARSLISKVNNVETSIEQISEGDLSVQAHDNSGDEFSVLTQNFNQLTSMLVGKTASMRELMNEVSSIISESVNIDALLAKITQLAKDSSNADTAVILLVDKFTDVLKVEHMEGFFPPPFSVSVSVRSKRALIEEKLKSTPIAFGSTYLSSESVLKGSSLFIKDTQLETDKLPLNSNPQDILFIKSSMTIPLVVSNKLLGVISLAKTQRDDTFSDLDFSNMVSFMEYVSLTIDNIYKYMELLEKTELKREMNIASQIQSQLLPKKIPVLPNIDVSAFSESARGISGDYYDIYKISKSKSVATVCDVAGKGIAAALVLVIIRTILQLASNSKSTAKDLLTFLNKSISDRVKTDYFATLSVLVYDDDKDELTIAVAGDTPFLIYRNASQRVERINHDDVPVGIDNTTVYTNKSIRLQDDDVLYMFSDGLLEVRNDFNDVFTIEELESFILENSNNRTETISLLLKNYLNEFRGSRNRVDDETVIIFKKI